jgi:hypothetical protein
MTTAENKPILRRKSMELLKDLTQILQEIIGSGDEESFVDWKKQSAIDESPKPRTSLSYSLCDHRRAVTRVE